MVPVGASPLPENTVFGQPKYNRIIIHTSKWNSLETARTYLAAQKAAGTPVQIAYQLATPEVYATDPLDFDNAEGPLVIMTGGEVKAAFKSADKVVESRIDFVEDTLNEQGQAIAEKAPICTYDGRNGGGAGGIRQDLRQGHYRKAVENRRHAGGGRCAGRAAMLWCWSGLLRRVGCEFQRGMDWHCAYGRFCQSRRELCERPCEEAAGAGRGENRIVYDESPRFRRFDSWPGAFLFYKKLPRP